MTEVVTATQKNYTCKRVIHDFYVFCIDECKAIILASGTINCYCCCCCCCCCILMSRYIFKRGVEGTVFLIPEWPWVPYKNMEVICIQFVYKKCTQIYSIVPNVYLMYTSKIQTGNVIDLHEFFSIQQ